MAPHPPGARQVSVSLRALGPRAFTTLGINLLPQIPNIHKSTLRPARRGLSTKLLLPCQRASLESIFPRLPDNPENFSTQKRPGKKVDITPLLVRAPVSPRWPTPHALGTSLAFALTSTHKAPFTSFCFLTLSLPVTSRFRPLIRSSSLTCRLIP